VSTTRKSAPIDTIPNLKNRRLTNGSAVRETGASLSSCPADYARRVHSCTICGWPPFITACTSAAPSGAGFRAAGTSTVGAVRGRSLAAWRCPLAPRACRACHRRGASRRRAHGSVGYGGRLLPQLLAANSSVTPPRDTVLPQQVGGGAWLGTPILSNSSGVRHRHRATEPGSSPNSSPPTRPSCRPGIRCCRDELAGEPGSVPRYPDPVKLVRRQAPTSGRGVCAASVRAPSAHSYINQSMRIERGVGPHGASRANSVAALTHGACSRPHGAAAEVARTSWLERSTYAPFGRWESSERSSAGSS
jgi:hypothetical protein